tara:strand:- start:627 stop:1247 length:621 start_codon:yes stop_codon:yes gene_type:complete
MHNEWGRKETAENNLYLSKSSMNTCEARHEDFCMWLNKNSILNPKILDVGCGNGNILNSFSKNDIKFKKYVGIDLNSYCIETTRRYKEVKNASFHHLTIEEVINNNLKKIEDLNICYFDSTFQMLENPSWVLKQLSNLNFDFFFLNRFYDWTSNKTENITYQWNGMKENSYLWKFENDFFDFLTDYLVLDQAPDDRFLVLERKKNV